MNKIKGKTYRNLCDWYFQIMGKFDCGNLEGLNICGKCSQDKCPHCIKILETETSRIQNIILKRYGVEL